MENLTTYIKEVSVLSEEQLRVVGERHGWYNRYLLAAGFTAHDCLRSLPRTLAAVHFATAGTEVTCAAKMEDAPPALWQLNAMM